MRSGAFEGLNANGINLRTLTVELLTGETILISTDGKTTCSAIWNRVQGELVARGVIHPQIFGLAIKTGVDWVFVDPDAKVSKYFPKHWKTTSAPSSSIQESKTLIVYCRVHFYLESLPLNFDVVSLLHYYLQLRQNLITTIRRHTTNLIQSLAYAYQNELGDWVPCQGTPLWSASLFPGVSSASDLGNLTRAHQGLAGLGQNAARTAFIRSLIPMYNMHLYGMTLRTKDGKDNQTWIGVTPKGIEVYQNELGRNEIPEEPKITFLWANITKLYFERKKFEIRGRACSCGGSTTEKLSFSSWSESVPRHLLLLCRSTHQFHLSNHKILLPTNNGSGGGDYKTSSSSTGTMSSTTSGGGDMSCNSTLLSSKNDDKMLDLSLWADGLLLPSGNESSEHQRVSVISNASSNTTSGIVSDRVYSLDGSEEDLELRTSDCCTERTHSGTNNSTSLESLSHKHPRSHHHLLKSHQSNGVPRSHHYHHQEVLDSHSQQRNESEAKYWYCDSDCEDDCDTGPCRSLLVRTINDGGEKHSCASYCQCNSCVAEEEAEEDEFERDSLSGDSSSNHIQVHHQNTPSLASEKTLKALDISSGNEIIEEMDIQNTKKEALPSENVYGEISEEAPKTEYFKNPKQYSEIEDEILPLKTKSKCVRKESNNRNNGNPCVHKKQKTSTDTTVASVKETAGLTPKVASLKCLRTQRVAPWTRIENSTDEQKLILGSMDEGDGCYIDFDKLQQGRYPSTRTVSDNFDTDSDYVQLPPFQPRPPPPKRPTTYKLWKFVNIKGNSNIHKSPRDAVDEVDSRALSFLPLSSTNTLPRRIPKEFHPENQLHENFKKLSMSKPMSKSTTAINTVSLQQDRPPEPPPKPRKLPPGSGIRISTKPVDARFISSKPQILIQTAYATPATVAVPSQAQILFRGSQVSGTPSRRTQSQIVQPTVKHSQSMDNIYDTVAAEESTVMSPGARKQTPLPPLPPPLHPKPSSSTVIIRPNNYIDVHASSPAHRNNKNQIVGSNIKPKTTTNVITSAQPPLARRNCPPTVVPPVTTNIKSKSGSVPNNLHTFYVGLQNLKPLSRAPIVYPTATSCSTLQANVIQPELNHPSSLSQVPLNSSNMPPYPYTKGSNSTRTNSTSSSIGPNGPKFTTVYTNQLTRSQIQQFKAQLYSDMDYVIFPPKDPRVSQQEYFDSKSLSLTTITSTNSNPMLSNAYSLSDIPPPYLPPPPPYHNPGTPTPGINQGNPEQQVKIKKPPKPLPATPTSGPPYQTLNSYQSLYNTAMSSNASQCSSSQYGGYYAMNGNLGSNPGSSSVTGLNAENLQKFLSTQSLAGSYHFSSPPPQIYYPASTHSAPPLPPYRNSNQLLIENGMRQAVQKLMAKTSLSPNNNDSIRMKLISRSEESLYSQPLQETEEKLLAIYNLPPPPPYKNKPTLSPSEVDLTSIRQKCTAMELPLLKALLNSSDGALITKQPHQLTKIRPTTHAHPNRIIPQEDSIEILPPPVRPPKPAKLRQPQTQQQT